MSDRLTKLNSEYTDADSVDKAHFAEMRSNCLLYIGTHYSNNKESALREYVRTQKIPQEKKLRLTKNHIGAICDRLMNATVTAHSPSVLIGPRHKMEVQDKKASDVASSVWDKIRTFNKFDELVADLTFDFIVIGEMATFTYFDPSKGEYLGEAEIHDEMGNVLGKKHKFSGEIINKRLEPFNLLRAPNSKSWEASPHLIYREMVDVEEARSLTDDEEIKKKITKSADETFVVFDSQKGSYSNSSKDKVLIKHKFCRPSEEYPEGWYVLYTSDVVIAEGSLYGVFPITRRAYSKVTTSPRGYGIIKRLRPCQAEINRIASTMAMSQIYFRDRLMVQNGSKITNGGTMAGAVLMRYSGAMPIVQQGQSGEKYLPILDQQISEMYSLANLSQEEEDKVPNTDPMALLYRSLKDKKKFSSKSDIFESFVKELVHVSLEVAQKYYTDENLVPSVDKKDFINIEEFKRITRLDYSIDIKSNSADIETTLGAQQAIQHTLQYAQGLQPEQVAVLVAHMPYLKDSAMAQEITADYRAVEDVFAAIERLQPIDVMPSDNHDYFIKRINNRMKESSFRYLDLQAQQLYHNRIQQHEHFKAEQADKLMRAQAGAIPSGGALIPVSLYLDPKNASKRVRLPHDTLVYVYKKLQEQGSFIDEVSDLGQAPASDIAGMMSPQQPQEHTQMSEPHQGLGDNHGF